MKGGDNVTICVLWGTGGRLPVFWEARLNTCDFVTTIARYSHCSS